MSGYDVSALRAQFPILEQEVHGLPLVYLDNAATSQKPRAVLDVSRHYYEKLNSNIHRGTHYLAQEATAAHEKAREKIATHLNAGSPDEIIFTSGTTDGINLISSVLGYSGRIGKRDSIVISNLEHHSNTVPWQMLCERTGAELKVLPVHEDGTLELDVFHRYLDENPILIALTHISNAFGSVLPVRPLIQSAHEAGALVLIDGAQAVPHLSIDVQELDADFYVFSGHKAYAPTGIGVLYGKREHLEALPPWRGGGEMIKKVDYAGTTYNDLPFKYEAGTPNIEGALALGAALDFLNEIGLDDLHSHEASLIEHAATALSAIEGLKLYGPHDRAGALSFNIDGIHHYDLGTLLDQMGVAVRTGHHCCQPLMARFGITGTIRASFACFNDEGDVQRLADAVTKGARMLR
ncbi:MAG: SufS family cysteine desulfurase [Roseibacillus sp.]|jgi:cysteine desulfurase/selenocysteine lyase|nr:SufS family cysteine desulfurase [Roseibacillus sp.]|tara:strand:+ start:256 stop:1479 length:1224 start_codon:yes stop_codon:yes gene_type:complete